MTGLFMSRLQPPLGKTVGKEQWGRPACMHCRLMPWLRLHTLFAHPGRRVPQGLPLHGQGGHTGGCTYTSSSSLTRAARPWRLPWLPRVASVPEKRPACLGPLLCCSTRPPRSWSPREVHCAFIAWYCRTDLSQKKFGENLDSFLIFFLNSEPNLNAAKYTFFHFFTALSFCSKSIYFSFTECELCSE